MKNIADWMQDFIIGLFVIIGVIFIAILSYFYIDTHKKPDHNPVITVSKLGYLIIDGDTTKYVLKEVKAYKVEKGGKETK